jgi:hypothetical protein
MWILWHILLHQKELVKRNHTCLEEIQTHKSKGAHKLNDSKINHKQIVCSNYKHLNSTLLMYLASTHITAAFSAPGSWTAEPLVMDRKHMRHHWATKEWMQYFSKNKTQLRDPTYPFHTHLISRAWCHD